MLSDWGDREPARQWTRGERLLHGIEVGLLAIVILTAAGGLLVQFGGWLLRLIHTMFA